MGAKGRYGMAHGKRRSQQSPFLLSHAASRQLQAPTGSWSNLTLALRVTHLPGSQCRWLGTKSYCALSGALNLSTQGFPCSTASSFPSTVPVSSHHTDGHTTHALLSWHCSYHGPCALIGHSFTRLPHYGPYVQQDSSQSHSHAAVSLHVPAYRRLRNWVPTHSCGLCDGPYADDSQGTGRVIQSFLVGSSWHEPPCVGHRCSS